MADIEQPGIETFVCNRYQSPCTLSIRACVARQKLAKEGTTSEKQLSKKCLKCNLGEQNRIRFFASGGTDESLCSPRARKREELKQRRIKEATNRIQNEGGNMIESSSVPQSDSEIPEKRICEICERELDLTENNFRKLSDRSSNNVNKGFSNKCKSCISENLSKGHKNSKNKKLETAADTEEHKNETYIREIDFSKIPELLPQLKKIATDELRSVNNMILYILREFVSANNANKE